jgi:hypothetical protein
MGKTCAANAPNNPDCAGLPDGRADIGAAFQLCLDGMRRLDPDFRVESGRHFRGHHDDPLSTPSACYFLRLIRILAQASCDSDKKLG